MYKRLIGLMVLILSVSSMFISQASEANPTCSERRVFKVIHGSACIIQVGTKRLITTIQHVGDFASTTFKSIEETTTFRIKVSQHVIDYYKLKSGQVLLKISNRTSTLIKGNGQVIAYVPDSIGDAFIESKHF